MIFLKLLIAYQMITKNYLIFNKYKKNLTQLT